MRRTIAGAIIGAAIASPAAAFAGATQAMHDDASYHHRATHAYEGPACEEDEVLWWVRDGVRSCMPLDEAR